MIRLLPAAPARILCADCCGVCIPSGMFMPSHMAVAVVPGVAEEILMLSSQNSARSDSVKAFSAAFVAAYMD
jgi:hypothetical protein